MEGEPSSANQSENLKSRIEELSAQIKQLEGEHKLLDTNIAKFKKLPRTDHVIFELQADHERRREVENKLDELKVEKENLERNKSI